MPRYAQGPALPPTVADLVDTLGANRARLAIIVYLHGHPGCSRGELTEAMGIGHQTVYSHLNALEQAGIVTGDVPGDYRTGRTVRYDLHSGPLQQQLQTLLHLLDGSGPHLT